MPLSLHPILQESFAQIDREVGAHELSSQQYAIVRRVIHATADFEFLNLVKFSPTAIADGIHALQRGAPIVTDVTMVRQGIHSLVQQTFQNPIVSAVDVGDQPCPGQTRTAAGLRRCLEKYSDAIYVIGNAPTALLALCEAHQAVSPTLVVGAPVGFVAVEASKQALSQTPWPQIRVEGRKGGSAVAAAIVNALLVLAWDAQNTGSTHH